MNRKFNILFWGTISILMFLLFGNASNNYIYSFYFLSFYMPIVILTSWIFNHVLVPRYLLKSKTKHFILYSIYLLVVSLDVELIFVFVSILLISLYDYENLGVIVDNYKWMPVLMYFIVILYAFIQVVTLLISKSSNDGFAEVKQHILVRSERKNRNLNLSEIVWIESMSDYVKIYLETGDIVITREKITKLSESLSNDFQRIHRSYIINLAHLETFSKEFISVDGKELPISRTYKKEVLERLSNF